MGLKGPRDRKDEPFDVESEREALRRQRVEAATSSRSLKRALSERVSQVQQRERELADALARVEKREQKLDATEERGSRLDSVRPRLAEAKEARSALDERRAELDARERELAAREAALETGTDQAAAATPPSPEPAVSDELDARDSEHRRPRGRAARRARARSPSASPRSKREPRSWRRAPRSSMRVSTSRRARPSWSRKSSQRRSPNRRPRPDELERIELKLAELREAEQAFVRTQHELARRSDSLTEQEAALAERERDLAARETPAPSPDLELLEARIRRLEQGGRSRPDEAADVQRRPARPPAARSPGQPRAGRASTLRALRGVSSAGRAPPLQGGGRRFDPGTLHTTEARSLRAFRLTSTAGLFGRKNGRTIAGRGCVAAARRSRYRKVEFMTLHVVRRVTVVARRPSVVVALLVGAAFAVCLGVAGAAPLGQIAEFGSPGSDPAQIQAGSDGNMWFSDRNGAVGRVTPDGTISQVHQRTEPGQRRSLDRDGRGRQHVVQRPGHHEGDRDDQSEHAGDQRIQRRLERRQHAARDRGGPGRQRLVHRQRHHQGDRDDQPDHARDHRVQQRPQPGQPPCSRGSSRGRTATSGSPTGARPRRSG